jgi:hypothetical protein
MIDILDGTLVFLLFDFFETGFPGIAQANITHDPSASTS